MKKFRGVIDGIRQTVNSSKPDTSLDVDETLRSDKFQLVKVSRNEMALMIGAELHA